MTINQALDKVLSLYTHTLRSKKLSKQLKEMQIKYGGRADVDSSLEVTVIEMVEDDKMY